MADDRRFREVNDYAEYYDFFSGFPNFHEADYGSGVVYGTILLRDTEAEWRDVARTEYGVYHIEDASHQSHQGHPLFNNCNYSSYFYPLPLRANKIRQFTPK